MAAQCKPSLYWLLLLLRSSPWLRLYKVKSDYFCFHDYGLLSVVKLRIGASSFSGSCLSGRGELGPSSEGDRSANTLGKLEG